MLMKVTMRVSALASFANAATLRNVNRSAGVGIQAGTSALCTVETCIEHCPRHFGHPAAARRGSAHGRLRFAFLDQHPADDPRVHPRHRPCSLDYLLAGEGT